MENCNLDFSVLNVDSWKTSSDDDYRFYKSSDQCDLCSNVRKTFYCRRCVKNGDFVHSTSRFSERFAEKRLKVMRMQTQKNKLIKECDKLIHVLHLRENKEEMKRMREEKIAVLHSFLIETQKSIEFRKKTLEEIRQFNQKGKENMQRNKECERDVLTRTKKLINHRPFTIDKLYVLRPCLKELIRRRIDELVKFIFPINEIQLAKSSSIISDSQEDIKNKLAEATRTAYVRGRWINDSWGETQHSIVAPTLPDSGDYSPYIHWISANKDNALVMTSSSGVDHNAAYNISAALTYVTQLVNIIAYYLDIRLPNKLYYSEFCTKQLNERKFMKCVTQLNANVLMLCLTQNVDPHLLQPSQTIRNLLLLLDPTQSELGRSDTMDIATSSISYFEEQLTHQLKLATARLSISDVEDEDKDPVWTENARNDDEDSEYDSDRDWEAVPLVSCPEAMPGTNSNRKPITSMTQTSSIAGGLVTSAATSLASIWRGWSVNK